MRAIAESARQAKEKEVDAKLEKFLAWLNQQFLYILNNLSASIEACAKAGENQCIITIRPTFWQVCAMVLSGDSDYTATPSISQLGALPGYENISKYCEAGGFRLQMRTSFYRINLLTREPVIELTISW